MYIYSLFFIQIYWYNLYNVCVCVYMYVCIYIYTHTAIFKDVLCFLM